MTAAAIVFMLIFLQGGEIYGHETTAGACIEMFQKYDRRATDGAVEVHCYAGAIRDS